MEYKELGPLEVDGDQLIKDFAYKIELITLSQLKYWKNKI